MVCSTSWATVKVPSPTTYRYPLGDRDHPPAHHQDLVVVAGDKGLDQDRALLGLGLGGREGGRHLLLGAQVEVDAAPWLPSSGLTTSGKPRRRAAATASSTSRTGYDRTGRPAAASSRAVSSSPATSTASELVLEVMVARMRCW